VKWLRTALFW